MVGKEFHRLRVSKNKRTNRKSQGIHHSNRIKLNKLQYFGHIHDVYNTADSTESVEKKKQNHIFSKPPKNTVLLYISVSVT